MKNNLTIPNIISAFRIVLIPVFVYLYFSKLNNGYFYAFFTIVLSSISDMADGIIARKFDMVSDLGKVLDPIADKLTQLALVAILCFKHPSLMPVLCVLFTKELLTAVAAALWLKKGLKPMSARWWGKVSTAFLYAAFMYYILSDIWAFKNTVIDYVIMIITIICLLFSMCGYIKTVLINTKA